MSDDEGNAGDISRPNKRASQCGRSGHALSSSLAAVGLPSTLRDRMYERETRRKEVENACALLHTHVRNTRKHTCVCKGRRDTGRGPERAKGASLEETDESST